MEGMVSKCSSVLCGSNLAMRYIYMAFLKDLGRRVAQTTEERSTTFLLQRLSVAVQRGNAASVLGTTGLPSGGTSID